MGTVAWTPEVEMDLSLDFLIVTDSPLLPSYFTHYLCPLKSIRDIPVLSSAQSSFNADFYQVDNFQEALALCAADGTRRSEKQGIRSWQLRGKDLRYKDERCL